MSILLERGLLESGYPTVWWGYVSKQRHPGKPSPTPTPPPKTRLVLVAPLDACKRGTFPKEVPQTLRWSGIWVQKHGALGGVEIHGW